MNLTPALSSVPNISAQPLTIKATASGIVLLKENYFRTRYTGNKYFAVDINGRLLKKAELIKELKAGIIPKKKTPKKNGATVFTVTPNEFSTFEPMQISNNL